MELKDMLMMMMTLLTETERASNREKRIICDDVSAMYAIYFLLKKLKRKEKTRRKFRLERRFLQGASHNLIEEMRLNDPVKYFNYFRMRDQIFQELLRLIGPHIEKHSNRTPISACTRLEITLRFLASGDSMTSISYAFRIGHNTVSKIVSETCTKIWSVLKDKVFIEPTEENWREISDNFENIWDFPNCIGAIDGKHVVIQASSNSGSSCYNYKGTHSLLLLAISDADGCFSIVDIAAQGRQSDAGVFANCGLSHLLDTNTLDLPPPTILENTDQEFPFVLVADEAFPLTKYMMRPFPRSKNMTVTQKIFNYRLSRARRAVKSAFGILAARWRIFRRPIIASVSTVTKIIQATTALHNFIMKYEQRIPVQERQYGTLCSEDRECVSSGLINVTRNRERNNQRYMDAVTVRNAFSVYFENINPLDWQFEKALRNDF